MVLLNIWNVRNNSIFSGVDEDACMIWDRATSLEREFRIHNLTNHPLRSYVCRAHRWKKLRLV